MSHTAAAQAVAHIAYLASDVVVSSHGFGSAFTALASSVSQDRKPSSVLQLSPSADPGSTLLRNRSAGLVSYVGSSHRHTLHSLVPSLLELSTSPVVLHIASHEDLSDVLALRSVVPYFIYSRTAQEAHDFALLASRLASVEGVPVLHVFNIGQQSEVVGLLAESAFPSVLGVEKPLDGTQSENPFASAAAKISAVLGHEVSALRQSGSTDAHTIIVSSAHISLDIDDEDTQVFDLSLLKPLQQSDIFALIPPSTTRIVVLEQVRRWSMKWTPLYLDIVSQLQERESTPPPVVHSCLLGNVSSLSTSQVLQQLEQTSSRPLLIGDTAAQTPVPVEAPHVPKHESSYTKILHHVFGDALDIANSPDLVPEQGSLATSPEYALGRVRGQTEQRAELISCVHQLLQDPNTPADLHSLLGRWLSAKDDAAESRRLGEEIVLVLKSTKGLSPVVERILALRSHFPALSKWIIGSDAWSYDIGASGLHHAIASKLNVNILILDTQTYAASKALAPHQRKQDVGLYAMNYGDVYVASVAVYSSYTQVLQALVEADKFDGPSVILAYLPYTSEDTPALDILKETKLAVDMGYWPLYRWNPANERLGREMFTLDSDAIKNDLQKFLDRQNHLSQLVRSEPQLAADLVGSLGENLKKARKERAQKAYEEMLSAIDAPPLLIAYASDGGKAEKFAKRLAHRGKARGLLVTLATLDATSLDELAQTEYVAFITSVAGQGEFPQNGRNFMKALNAITARNEQPLTNVKYTVFGMGDSHYWPRPEDAHYYNKAGKDLDARLAQLGAQRVVNLGLGDDQDADGPDTGYKLWEPLLWKVLGVDSVQVHEAEPEPITNEHIKVASQYLRGTIVQGLQDDTTGALAASDTQLTKFHGIYQQDDRDIRDEREAEGVEPAYSFMIRVRMPGGVCTPQQWKMMHQIADEHGNGTFKITTRQTFQFHGVIKRHLKSAIQDINRVLLDTLAACGDVNRNVITSAIPSQSKLHAQVYAFAKGVSEHLMPRTTAYHEIWLDKKLVAGEALKDVEPLYGEFYLPRKFKVAVAVPPTNDVDLFANDVGFIAIVGKHGHLEGFNVTAGGGMGVTHGNKKTYPRLGDVLGFCTVEQGKDVAEKIMLVQRDNGNRQDRKNARLKYTIDRMGLDVFKAEVERRLGYQLQPARPFAFDRNVDDFGWHTSENGKHHFTTFIENGRIQDEPGRDFKTGLLEIAQRHKGTFRLTANQHVIISDIEPGTLPEIKKLLAQYKLDNLSYTGLRLSSSACVAFPTCGLAMAESERYLPLLIDKVEKICENNGLRNDSIVMRMTGCPNGCARPYVAEVAFVGKAPGVYLMLLGGGYHGQRLNKIYRETVTEPEILAILEPMIKHYALKRLPGEHFGDFVIRAGYIAPTESGIKWYDGMGGLGQYRESAGQ